MNRVARLTFVLLFLGIALSMDACSGGSQGDGGTNPNLTTPKVTVTPAVNSIATTQSLRVAIVVTGTSGTPTGSVVLSCGSYSSNPALLNSGSATINIPVGSLAAGTGTLTAKYTPDSASTAIYTSASGTASVTVTQPATAPTVTVTPAASSITTAQSLGVTITVAGTSGIPTGSVVLSSGSYTSSAATLNAGSATITIPAGALATGADTLTGAYSPDSGSSATYKNASGMATVTVTATTGAAVNVNIDVLANRHAISPFIYGGNLGDPSTISDSGTSLARWGGNATSNYNWQLHTYNAGGDWYFEDFGMGTAEKDSVQFITDVQNAGSHPLTTMSMMDWVAKEAENGSNRNWSYSVATYGKQCSVDPYNTDAGNGMQTDCKTPATTSPVTSAYYPLLDSPSQACPTGNCVYRDAWANALSAAFSSGTCPVPYTTLTSCHFYDMDNEPDIWGGTHRDVHPTPTGYDELAHLYETEAAALKTWDPAAVRFGPVSCCWWFYWNVGPSGDDKAAHGGVDFLPWWLNQIYWLDNINGSRTLDVFDIHAYPDADTTGMSDTQKKALSASIYRDYWDPTYVSTSGTVNQPWATSTQPNYSIPFRIPRFKAMVNAIYPGTPLSFTEWSAAFYNESDFSTALGDADAYGIMGREGLSFAARWGAPSQANPNYQALRLYANYDGAHHGFGTVSVSDLNNGDPNLFSSYAALNSDGTVMTIMVINKDPSNTAQVTFNLSGFNPSTYLSYTLASTAPGTISASISAAWKPSQNFAPYSITLLVVSGTESARPASEWYLNPDDLMIPASGTATLHPEITGGSATVTLSSAVFDAYEGAAACSGSLTLTNPTITASLPASVTVNPGGTPGFCHYTITGADGTATQTQGGWIVVGIPAAMLTVTGGNNQSGTAGTALSQSLAVTLSPGQSGGSNSGASILFTTSAGTLSNGTSSGTSVIARTDSSGVASVTLTLPSTKGTVTVTAQNQFALGGASVTFTESAN